MFPPKENVLKAFKSIGLEDIGENALTDRVDTKFIFHRQQLNGILQMARNSYEILEIDGERLMSYRNRYYDTEELKFYYDHHNGKKNRTKIRLRSYVGSNLSYLEIKKKYNTGRLQKFRMKIDDDSSDLSRSSELFIEKHVWPNSILKPVLENSFQRITLSNPSSRERITFDINLNFKGKSGSSVFENLVIAEIKQSRIDRSTEMFRALQEKNIKPYRISKYCIGVMVSHDGVKKNAFKDKMRKINKIMTN